MSRKQVNYFTKLVLELYFKDLSSGVEDNG